MRDRSLSVVISTRDRPLSLDACLKALRATLSSDDKIVVVDSASRDPEGTASVAEKHNASFLRTARTGSARARNIGIGNANGDIIAFVDDDALVEPGWRDAMLQAFDDPEVSIVCGPVFESNSERLLLDFRGFDASRDRVEISRKKDDWFDRLALGAVGSGANFAARREVFERIGGFREALGSGAWIPGDENFFFFSAVVDGMSVVSDPQVRVSHPAVSEQRSKFLRRMRIPYVMYISWHFPFLVPRILMRGLTRTGA